MGDEVGGPAGAFSFHNVAWRNRGSYSCKTSASVSLHGRGRRIRQYILHERFLRRNVGFPIPRELRREISLQSRVAITQSVVNPKAVSACAVSPPEVSVDRGEVHVILAWIPPPKELSPRNSRFAAVDIVCFDECTYVRLYVCALNVTGENVENWFRCQTGHGRAASVFDDDREIPAREQPVQTLG